jgi:hypothetical protein
MVQSEMDAADARSRSGRKNDAGTDALANGARLAVLEKHLGTKIKRHRTPDTFGSVNASGTVVDTPGKQKEDSVIIKID